MGKLGDRPPASPLVSDVEGQPPMTFFVPSLSDFLASLRHVRSIFLPLVTRPSSRNFEELEPLVLKLTRALGDRKAALRELQWMKQALAQSRSPRAPPLGGLPSLVDRRAKGEPLQYVLGTQPFGPLGLLVRPPTLIPRPETEYWATELTEILKDRLVPLGRHRRMRILDLCTGTGCIPLLLLKSLSLGAVHATAVDVAHTALELTRDNALEHHVPLVQGLEEANQHQYSNENTLSTVQADVIDSDALLAHPAVRSSLPFDAITCNPPYIPHNEYINLDSSVKDWEDPGALLGDPSLVTRSGAVSSAQTDSSKSASHPPLPGGQSAAEAGLTFYHAVAQLAARPGVLSPGSPLVLEVGHNQAASVSKILEDIRLPEGHAPFSKTNVRDDQFGCQRVVVGWKG